MFRRRSCPLEEMSRALFKHKMPKIRCESCEYWQNRQCKYEGIAAERLSKAARGTAALTQRTLMRLRREQNIRGEVARIIQSKALELSGLNDMEQKEYLEISKAYGEEWEKADPAGKNGIERHIEHWQLYMESGLSPREAEERAKRARLSP